MTPGQGFAGILTESDWEAMESAEVSIAHNSWFTADLPKLFTDPDVTETPLIGLAWGTFDLSKPGGQFYQGSYALFIGGPFGGALAIDSSCDPDPGLSAALGAALGVEVEARISVVGLTDAGEFVAGPDAAAGDFDRIGDSGTVAVKAEGCLGAEASSFSVKSVREP